MSDLDLLLRAEEKVLRWRAEREYASAQLELEMMKKNMRYLISQHDPLHSIDVDRNKLRLIFDYILHGDEKRLIREHLNMEGEKSR